MPDPGKKGTVKIEFTGGIVTKEEHRKVIKRVVVSIMILVKALNACMAQTPQVPTARLIVLK